MSPFEMRRLHGATSGARKRHDEVVGSELSTRSAAVRLYLAARLAGDLVANAEDVPRQPLEPESLEPARPGP